MANILDYLEWRGDLSLRSSAFNDVDALILSRLSYLLLDGIVPAELDKSILTGDAMDVYLRDVENRRLLQKEDPALAAALRDSRRFRRMRLMGYRSHLDAAAEKQFAALTIDLENGTHFVAYRGTDNTLVGWKEDFNMTFLDATPSQKEAVAYLAEAAAAFSGLLRLGGHSKGGNLAVYAAACSPVETQQRITRVYNCDGPGFQQHMLDSEGYRAVCDRVRTFAPQSTVIGMLLGHKEAYSIVHSTQMGILQHDLYSWQVQRDHFVLLNSITNSSRFVDQTISAWIASVSPEQRRVFIDTLFDLLSATQANTLKELSAKWYRSALAVLKYYGSIDDTTKEMLAKTMRLLLRAAKNNLLE